MVAAVEVGELRPRIFIYPLWLPKSLASYMSWVPGKRCPQIAVNYDTQIPEDDNALPICHEPFSAFFP